MAANPQARKLKDIQEVIYQEIMDAKPKGVILAQVARAYCEVTEKLRDAMMKPKAKPIDVTLLRKRKPTVETYTEEETPTPLESGDALE